MLTKLTLGEKLKDLRLAKGYKSTEHLASILNIPKTTLRILHSENKKDTQVVSGDTGGLSILIELIQKLKDFKGTPQEIKLKLFTLILGTDINRLNKQEKAVIQTLIKKGEMTWKKS